METQGASLLGQAFKWPKTVILFIFTGIKVKNRF